MERFLQISLVLEHRTMYSIAELSYNVYDSNKINGKFAINIKPKQLIRKRKTTKNTQQCNQLSVEKGAGDQRAT